MVGKMLAADAALPPFPVVPGDEKRTSSEVVVAVPTTMNEEDRDCITKCVDALFDVLELFGMDSRHGKSTRSVSTMHSYNRTIEHWITTATPGGDGAWMAFAKYKFAAFFHTHTRQLDVGVEPPKWLKGDQPGLVASGIASKYVKMILRGPQRMEFLTTISQLKKGCPRPTKAMVDQQVKKSFKSLTEVQRVHYPSVKLLHLWGDIKDDVEHVLEKATVMEQLRRTVREVYGGLVYGDKDRYKPRLPSTKATYHTSVKKGGAVSFMKQVVNGMGLSNWTDDGDGACSVDFEVKEESYNQAYGQKEVVYTADVRATELKYELLYHEALARARTEIPLVKPVGLAESLKIRVITKGPEYMGFVLKPLQKFMHTHLRGHPVFALIGKPVDKWFVQNRVGAKLPAGYAYLSGDYSAATDNLAPWVSDCIADEIATVLRLTELERELLVRSLTGHVFVDEKGNKHEQKWGQLMGSVTSFPVLCIANAAFCRWAIELDEGKAMKLVDTSLMVNGDDCLFKCTRRGLDFWKKITTYGGLTPSIGKFFFTREFAQINSTNYIRRDEPVWDTYNEKDRLCHFDDSKYINLGLLYGLKRSGEKLGKDAAADPLDGLGVRCHELVQSAPHRLRCVLMEKFIGYHRKALDVQVPWFVPMDWGGVGLPVVFTDEDLAAQEYFGVFGEQPKDYMRPRWFPTDKDLRYAHAIKSNPKKYPVSKPPALGTWQMHKIAMTRLPDCKFSVPTEEEEKAFSALYAYLVVDSLFSGHTLQTSEDGAAKRCKAVLRRNERSWTEVRKLAMTSPLSYTTLTNTKPAEPITLCAIVSNFDDFVNPLSEDGEAWDDFVAVDGGLW